MIDNPSPETYKALQDEIDLRMKVDQIFNDIFPHHMEALKAREISSPLESDFPCYEKLMDSFEEKCGFSEYAFKYYGALVAECQAINSHPEILGSTMDKLDSVCNKETKEFIN